jgi:nucleoside recognition membrane protein YjiH
MRANWFSNLTYLLGGAFLVVVSQAFTHSVAGWIAFGVSTGIVVIALGNVLLTTKRVPQVGHAAILVVALWSLIAALLFSGATLGWWILGDGVALAAVAMANLGLHEFSTERVVHELQLVAPHAESPQAQHEAA